MGVMRVGQCHSPAEDLGAQVAGPVDADVAAFVAVVFVGQQPANPLRQPAGHTDRQRAADLEHPDQFGDGGVVVRDVLENLRRDDAVECLVGVGQLERVTDDHRGRRAGRRLAAVGHRAQDGVDRTQFGLVLVEGDDVGAAPVGLERVPARAAAHVDDLARRPDAQPVEIDRQHGARPAALRAIARS